MVDLGSRRAFSIFALVAIAAGLGACRAHLRDSPAQRALARLPLGLCEVPGVEEQLLCGRLDVPEDHGGSGDRTISLNIIVVPALSVTPHADAFVEFLGSPGFAATSMARLYTEDLALFRQDRDVILVDQRGTGGSSPLACEGVAGTGVSELLERWPPSAVAECQARLARSADLAKYATVDAAHDMDAVRAWLGYDFINLFGASYGSRVALEYMRQYPLRVRSAVLFGAVPPHFRRPLYFARDAQRGMDLLLEDCALDDRCSQAFPAVREELLAVLDQLQEDPIEVSFADSRTGAPLQGMIDPFTFSTVLWEALMRRSDARRVPLVIHRAARGDFQPFLDLAVASRPASMPYYEGMHLSVTCPDETLHIMLDEIEQEHVGSFMPSDRVTRHLRACELWHVPRSPTDVLDPVRADVPTLLVSGYMDPVTPPRWADAVARHLPQSRHIVIRHMSHSVDSDCIDLLAAAFVASPSVDMEEHPCVAELLPLPFMVEP
jgi:pimeloyl-ACP methyl ester carboxylesterase